MARIDLTYAITEEVYSDGDVECDLLKYIEEHPDGAYEDILKTDKRWPVFYHLTSLRENILSWYDFKDDCDILEIGAGLGALTGMLCRKAKTVTAVELMERRANILYQRHSNCENLDIFVGNFCDIKFSKKFDYITLIGVLEYSPGYMHDDEGPKRFLQTIKSLLKPGGKILIAIENRMGLKYWCGANEDHTGVPFSGINGYVEFPRFRTYSRDELKELLKNAGLSSMRFFYPLPDYKLPQIIYSDLFLPKRQINSKIRQYYLDKPQLLVDERAAFTEVIRNGALPFMANSFLVECAREDVALSEITFASFTPERKLEYQVATVIEKNEIVKKSAMNPKAKQHISDIYSQQNLFSGNALIKYQLKDQNLSMPYIDAPTLEYILCGCFENRDIMQVQYWIDKYLNCIKKSSDIIKPGKDPILRYGFIDMTFSNCFVKEDTLLFYDQEWLEKEVQVSFILFRALRTFYEENPTMEDFIPRAFFINQYFYNSSQLEKYEKQALDFLLSVTLTENNPLAYLDECKGKKDYMTGFEKHTSCVATCYFDRGDGYIEKDTIKFDYNPAAPLSFHCDVPTDIISIRFDPVENLSCIVHNLEVVSNRGILATQNLNGYTLDSFYLFCTNDPQIQINLLEPVSWIRIQANVFCFDSIDLIALIYDCINTLDIQKKTLAEEKEKYCFLQMEGERNLTELRHQTEKQKLLWSEAQQTLQKRITQLECELAHYQQHYYAAIGQREELKRQLACAENAYNMISSAVCWKLTKPIRVILDTIKKLLKKSRYIRLFYKGLKCLKQNGFMYTWKKVRNRRIHRQDFSSVGQALYSPEELDWQRAASFDAKIKFSILVPLFNTPEAFLHEMIRSVMDQTYANWELCLADGSDTAHSYVGKICSGYHKQDSRIKYKKLNKNLGISENTNACINLASGDYFALLDHDDLLHPAALYENMKVICSLSADMIYSDEVVFEGNLLNIIAAHFKPDYAPDTLRGCNYICHFTVFSRDLFNEIHPRFNSEYDGSQDYDLVLRLTEKAKHIIHIPKALYNWRVSPSSVAYDISAKPYTVDAAKRALQAHLDRCGLDGTVKDAAMLSTYRIQYRLLESSLVSIIIPNKDHIEELQKCIDSIHNISTYRNWEIIVVENNSENSETFSYYEKIEMGKKAKVITWEGEFNYAAINNFGAQHAEGNYLLMLNNDTEIITPDWLEQMLMFAQRQDVGAVGAMLYYENDTIQHGGVILGIGGFAGHSHKGFPRGSGGHLFRLCTVQNLSSVTGACIMVRRDVWDHVRGLDESFVVALNDVDFCMRIRRAGYLVVWTPFAELYHYESLSRGYEDTPEKQRRFEKEVNCFKTRWKKELDAGDPYYNPNLTLDREDFSLK